MLEFNKKFIGRKLLDSFINYLRVDHVRISEKDVICREIIFKSEESNLSIRSNHQRWICFAANFIIHICEENKKIVEFRLIVNV